jgi:formiminoglutamase
VPIEVVEHVCVTVAASGKLAACDVAELNPRFDADNRRARAAARLIRQTLTWRRRRVIRPRLRSPVGR